MVKLGDFFKPENVLTIIIVALALVYVISSLGFQIFGIGSVVKVGSSIVLVTIALAVIVAMKIVFTNQFSFGFTDFIILVITMIIVGGVIFYLPVAAPNLFSTATQQLVQSITGG